MMEQQTALSRSGRKHRVVGGKRKRKAIQESGKDEGGVETKKEEERKEDREEEKEEEEVEEKEDKTLPNQWNCPACTYLNDISRQFCEMCETSNPSPAPAAARTLGSAFTASEWSCVACTMVNPAALRICAVCGTLNPRPPRPTGLSIARLSSNVGDESVSSCSEDSDDDSVEEEDDEEETWKCSCCGTQSLGRTCSNCFAKRPKIARKVENTTTNENHKKAKSEQLLVRKRKRRKYEKKQMEKAKIAYGISIYELKKLLLEPTSSRLVVTLQALTHTLAMMDASADNEWTDGPSFLIRTFGGGSSSDTAKDPELLTVLVNIFCGRERTYPAEVRLLAVQSINYLMKMDRLLHAQAKMVEVVRLQITELLAWNNSKNANTAISGSAKSEQQIVEECLSGMSSMCTAEGFARRVVVAQDHFVGFLDFLLRLVDGNNHNSKFHPSIVMTALDILHKCCMTLRWSAKSRHNHRLAGSTSMKKHMTPTQSGKLTLELAIKLVDFLRHVLLHKHIPLHVKAAKCLLLLFHRVPPESPDVMNQLVTPEVLRRFVALVISTSSEESEESRFAMVNLLLYLFDTFSQLVNMLVQEKIYVDLFSGILPLLQSSSTGLRTNVLKMISLLTRVVCKAYSSGSATSSFCDEPLDLSAFKDKASPVPTCRSRASRLPRTHQRLDTSGDTLSMLLLDFIRMDSIHGVNILLQDGADLNFPRMLDAEGNELDKPLNVAVECASLRMVRLLVKRGADIHQVGIGGTGLHVAARTGRCHIAAFLLQYGARIEAKDREKKTVMDIVDLTDKTGNEKRSIDSIPSPMKKLLEIHQCTAGVRDYDSDFSESDDIPDERSQGWFHYTSDQDDEYEEDDDDDMDDDEFEGDEGYYMDFDDEDDDDEEDMNGIGQHNENAGGCSDVGAYNDDAISGVAAPSSKGCLDSIELNSNMKIEGGESSVSNSRSAELNEAIEQCPDGGGMSEQKPAVIVTDGEVYEFSLALIQALLALLHVMDIQNVDRCVISTMACVLEMAPSQLFHALKEKDVELILDLAHFLLEGEKPLHAGTGTGLGTAPASLAAECGGAANSAYNLPSLILAIRILEAVVRKSPQESSIFYQMERRGISEQIEMLDRSKHDDIGSYQIICERGLSLLKTLQSDMLESGMLHLHKLRNLGRRLKELSVDSASSEKELVLVDLVELFDQPNSVTTYEFKQSELLPAIIRYLSPQGELNRRRARALLGAFERNPSALKHLIFRLQSIITREEMFPLVTFNSGKGREFYPLTRQLKIAFVRFGDKSASGKPQEDTCGRIKEELIETSTLTHFQSFERSVFRCMPVIDSGLSLLYLNLVGHSIKKVVEGKWRNFLIVGYDDTRSYHLVKPIVGTNDDLVEMVVHDSQCRLIENVQVYEDVSLDLALFGSVDAVDLSHFGNGKKKRRSKRKRKSFSDQLKQLDSNNICQVEVKNAGILKLPKLPGAWYSAILVDNKIVQDYDLKGKTCEEVLATQSTHSVKLLVDNRILYNVPAECLRPRLLQPQVGSVVEVDGLVGEVTRIYNNDGIPCSSANILLDVKTSFNVEKTRVKKDRIRFPAHPTIGSRVDDQIEAMSMRRLLSARDSSLLPGRIGDRVWVLPPSGSRLADLCVAGTIKSYPSGLGSFRHSATVLVEVSFGSKPPLAVSVNQDRLLNFAVDRSPSSGHSPSRLLTALQMASGRGSSSRGGGRTGQNCNSSVVHQAFERVAGTLRQSRLGGGQGSSGIGIGKLRSLMSLNPTLRGNAPRDVDPVEQATTVHNIRINPPQNELIEGAEEGASTSFPLSVSVKVTNEGSGLGKEKKIEQGSSALLSYLKPQNVKPKRICSQLPTVRLVMGFRKCDTSAVDTDRIVISSEFGLELVDKRRVGSRNTDTPASSSLIELNSSKRQLEVKPGSRKAFLDVFNSFSVTERSPKKKRKKLSPVDHSTLQSETCWDIEKFIAFMQAVREPARYNHSDKTVVKCCIIFSKFADPVTNRKMLKADGFLSFVMHECKDAAKSKQMLNFLRTRGYLAESLVSDHSNSDDAEEKKKLPDDGFKTTQDDKSSSQTRQPIMLRGFPADQCVLKCMEELRREKNGDRVGITSSDHDTADSSLPPWKLTYRLYCDYRIEWEAQSSSKTDTSQRLVGSGTKSLEPLSAVVLKSPTPLFTNGLATLGSDPATVGLVWLQSSTRQEIHVPDSMESAIRLLHYLFLFHENMASVDEALWTNPRLYNRLEAQMRDVLSMCSGIYPPWCDALVTQCKFFFSRNQREKLFRCTSFGCTRALHWFRNQLHLQENSTNSSTTGGSSYNQEITISPIPKERVKIYRENIVQSAEVLMKMHAKRKAILDVIFAGEKGYGSGVTAAFYSTVAHALRQVTENHRFQLWIPGYDDEVEAVHGADVVGDIAGDAPVICHSNGLFPYPHRNPSWKLVERFRLMGRLAGKALMDQYLLPLPLSPQFMGLVVGESVGLEELENIFLSHGRIIYSMYRASKKIVAGEQNVQIENLDVEDWLNAVGFTFLDPFSQEPLVAGGEDLAVTPSNLTLYVQSVLELWLDSGIRTQVVAFREGISEVLPLGKLRLLYVPELLSLLCGEEDIKWDVESLTRETKIEHGYTKESPPVQYFFKVLEEMSGSERRAFLLYVTGCPNLPPGGFQALKPPFEVVRRVVDTVDVDRALPFARTCSNTLHLPAYSSKHVLAKQMAYAIANSRGVIDRD
ncbi:hypothetical protein PsorP6_000398 [Peronosclerospora sorghi]|uniref:Uncharacterized protein n=1 Tax=Peronosclerospora sorghi TaxID=230839 RepID=A0ACC0WXC7_9STRA|nr:hypothetical protein PsorP6_000398 [Peronosclerospora sorghi]